MPAPSLLTVVSSTPSNDAMDGAQFLMCSFWVWALLSSPDAEFDTEFADPSGTY